MSIHTYLIYEPVFGWAEISHVIRALIVAEALSKVIRQEKLIAVAYSLRTLKLVLSGRCL